MLMRAAGSMKQNVRVWRNQGKSEKWCSKQDGTEKEREYLEINHLYNHTWGTAGMVPVVGTAFVFFLEGALQWEWKQLLAFGWSHTCLVPGTWRQVKLCLESLGCICSLATGPLLAAQMQHLVSTGPVSQTLVLSEGTLDFPLLSWSFGYFLLEMCCRKSQAGFELPISSLTTLTCCSDSKSLKGCEQTWQCWDISLPWHLTWLKHRDDEIHESTWNTWNTLLTGQIKYLPAFI